MQVSLKNFILVKKIVRLVSSTCAALVIYGCSSTEESEKNKEQIMTPEQQQLFILNKVESWSAAEPEIQRVLELESDMQLIIEQLASMAELDANPLQNDKKTAEKVGGAELKNTEEKSTNINIEGKDIASSDIVTSVAIESTLDNNIEEGRIAGSISSPNKTPSSDPVRNNAKMSSKSLGHYFPKIGLHIAMFKNLNNVPLAWQYLQTILPADFVNKKPLLAKIHYENSEYYSLRVGPLKSANAAKAMCLKLQQQQHYCSVVEYKGFLFKLDTL